MRILRFLLATLFLAALVYTGWWAFGRSPEQEVLAAQNNFLEAVADRDWEAVAGQLAGEFTSSAGHNRDTAIADAQQVLGGFLTLTLQSEQVNIQTTSDQAVVDMKILVSGTGSGLSQIILARAREMHSAPWLFEWQKQGSWPWNWKLIKARHPDLTQPLPQ